MNMAATLTRAELTARSRTARVATALAIGGGATAILAGIPAGKRVCIWKIHATRTGVAGADQLQMSSCAAGGAVETNIIGRYHFVTGTTLDVGGEIESPFIVVQNATPAAGASANVDIGVSHLTAALDVTISYYLLP